MQAAKMKPTRAQLCIAACEGLSDAEVEALPDVICDKHKRLVAYPKLVEALKGIALRHDDGTRCFDGCMKAGLHEPSPFCQRYQALLRDLGEE